MILDLASLLGDYSDRILSHGKLQAKDARKSLKCLGFEVAKKSKILSWLVGIKE